MNKMKTKMVIGYAFGIFGLLFCIIGATMIRKNKK